MTDPPGNSTLLAGAVRYALGSVACVAPGLLSRPTPCADWNLAALLEHFNDSLAAFCEGTTTGHIGLHPATQPPAAGAGGGADALVATFRDRASQLLATSPTPVSKDIAIAGQHLDGSTVTAVGTVEIAVHGWDVAEACGRRRPIPPALATGILRTVPLVVTDATRHDRFAAPVPVSPLSSPGDRLVARLGRNPRPHRKLSPCARAAGRWSAFASWARVSAASLGLMAGVSPTLQASGDQQRPDADWQVLAAGGGVRQARAGVQEHGLGVHLQQQLLG